MKIMVYGFEPYNKELENISEKIVKKLPNSFQKIIFPVRFNKKQFLEILNHKNPDIIIGLGQHPRAKKIRIERVGKNLRGKKTEKKLKINMYGKDRISVNLKLQPLKNMRISYNAGTFVCNYSIYICQEWANEKGKKFAFIHVPKLENPNVIVSYLSMLSKSIK